jgi:hypothetical protein
VSESAASTTCRPAWSRSILAVTFPAVPEDRLRALRAAFLAAMKDPDFIKETAALNIEVDPVAGEAMQKIVANVLATPKSVAERAKPLLE